MSETSLPAILASLQNANYLIGRLVRYRPVVNDNVHYHSLLEWEAATDL